MSSNPFGSPTPNLFSPGTAASPYAPTLGLRQRPNVANGGGGGGGDQNANPNRNINTSRGNVSRQGFGKWGSMSNVPAPPPRMSLSTAGKSPLISRPRVSAAAPQQTSGRDNTSTTAEASQQAIVPTNEREEEDLSLWVIGYGYRNEAHFRALYHRLESCGTITARRGGMSCFGEDKSETVDSGNNWVAVKFESALHCAKALCQHGSFVGVGGSVMIMGVMPCESDAAAKLGINVNKGSLGGKLTLARSYNKNYNRNDGEILAESDVMLIERERGEVTSGLDRLVGNFLGWFFMWPTQA